jgi:hypothetical protein
MQSLHLIRSLRHALEALRDASDEADANRIARSLIIEIEVVLREDAFAQARLLPMLDARSFAQAGLH